MGQKLGRATRAALDLPVNRNTPILLRKQYTIDQAPISETHKQRLRATITELWNPLYIPKARLVMAVQRNKCGTLGNRFYARGAFLVFKINSEIYCPVVIGRVARTQCAKPKQVFQISTTPTFEEMVFRFTNLVLEGMGSAMKERLAREVLEQGNDRFKYQPTWEFNFRGPYISG